MFLNKYYFVFYVCNLPLWIHRLRYIRLAAVPRIFSLFWCVICILVMYMYMCMGVLVPLYTHSCQSTNSCKTVLYFIIWALEIELRSSGLTASTFTY